MNAPGFITRTRGSLGGVLETVANDSGSELLTKGLY
jgi:hypothetical protein